jgi:N-methylhydantoinase B/oxoprolinase/acetone carboxylase alpha subunit
MPLSVRAAIDSVSMQRGDIVVLNDPFQGGTHLPDITLVSPVFVGREKTPTFYVANRAHHSDVGGMSPGSMPVAREIYQEGLIIPPILLVKGGAIVKDVWNLILANVRTPDEREGDLSAQIAANRVAERRLLDVVRKYGRARAVGFAKALQDYTERVVRAAISRIPAGAYEFEDALDDDGFGSGPVGIRARITIGNGRATIDFTGSDPQVTGSVNANYAITLSACLYAFRCLVDEDVLYNAGVARPLTVIAPSGSIVNATKPSAVAGGNVETSQRITDVVFGALGKALPDRMPAASQGTMNNITLGGSTPSRFAYYETMAGGMGGRKGMAGLSGVHTHMSNTRNTPVEAIEHYLPVRITQYALRKGSGGKGAARGGDGIVREYEMLTDTSVTLLSDRRERGPYGAQGGAPGSPGRNTLIRAGGSGTEEKLPGKVQMSLSKGDRLKIETPGGGGYGG